MFIHFGPFAHASVEREGDIFAMRVLNSVRLLRWESFPPPDCEGTRAEGAIGYARVTE
jgi:hypothetical protein